MLTFLPEQSSLQYYGCNLVGMKFLAKHLLDLFVLPSAIGPYDQAVDVDPVMFWGFAVGLLWSVNNKL